jgi:hypothetical protein
MQLILKLLFNMIFQTETDQRNAILNFLASKIMKAAVKY